MAYKYSFRGNDEALAESPTPVIVLTGNGQEYADFLENSGREKGDSIAVTSPHQFDFYPNLKICHYGSYWLNPAYDSAQYNDRLRQILEEGFENEQSS